LEELSKRCGTFPEFPFQAASAWLEIRAGGDLVAMIQKGREVLLQLESIASIDLQSIQAADFPNFWIETVRVVSGLNERIAHVDAVFRLPLDTQTRTM
jgi:hypothetical protein